MTKYVLVQLNGEERPLQLVRSEGDQIYLKDPDMSFQPKPHTFIKTGVEGFDHTLGGGLVAGKLVYLCGFPGVGVTTLLTQVACAFANEDRKTLFVTSEPVLDVLRLAERIGVKSRYVELRGEFLVKNLHEFYETPPKLLVINLIYDLLVDQLDKLKAWAQRTKTCVILTGYLDKEGEVREQEAAYRADVLAVLAYSRKDDRDAPKADDNEIRVLTTEKNRLGKENLRTYWRMTREGLKRVGRAGGT